MISSYIDEYARIHGRTFKWLEATMRHAGYIK